MAIIERPESLILIGWNNLCDQIADPRRCHELHERLSQQIIMFPHLYAAERISILDAITNANLYERIAGQPAAFADYIAMMMRQYNFPPELTYINSPVVDTSHPSLNERCDNIFTDPTNWTLTPLANPANVAQLLELNAQSMNWEIAHELVALLGVNIEIAQLQKFYRYLITCVTAQVEQSVRANTLRIAKSGDRGTIANLKQETSDTVLGVSEFCALQLGLADVPNAGIIMLKVMTVMQQLLKGYDYQLATEIRPDEGVTFTHLSGELSININQKLITFIDALIRNYMMQD